ncbi:HAD family phosphatase [Methylococcus sp. EFPC2]|uniref:histidinol-phosphatase n=1 Tax=Methylococcus sp. EFPC2 TaxID=2812648 RepID=UPI00196751CA|nr:HAD family hydrolase [Methylococcus sp. EFPC2]QSA98287.1 HAD family hydrolase [Methylococcus sp. EFPC2]
MSLAIFDLDNTLIAGDSDYLWGQFLVDQGIVDREHYETSNAEFYRQYREGRLDIAEFLAFALKPLAEHPVERLHVWREQFVREKILPILLPAARDLIAKHRDAGDLPVVITATNRFVTEPIVGLYGIEHLIATTPEFSDGRYTGRHVGVPCFQDGKVKRLDEWRVENDHALADSWFYSDSHNDLPLLSRVGHPVAVDPDEILADEARARGWPIISLR